MKSLFNDKKNEIKLIVDVKKNEINKEIYFLNNIDYKFNIQINRKNNCHDFLNELNEKDVDIYINNKKYKNQKYFKPEKEGLYEILLSFNVLIKDCSFMFYSCPNIIKIDLSSFDTKNVTNMGYIFADCCNIMKLDLSSFDTKNVNNMEFMFAYCFNLV